MTLSRRTFLGAVAAAAGRAEPAALRVAIFSKHLRFVEGEELAAAAKSMGFDGIDLTVRAGGHVLPERVAQDLPPIVKAARAADLEVPIVTTGIVDADTPHAERMIATIAEQGIPCYRWSGLRYRDDEPVQPQLDGFRARVGKLAALSAKHRVRGLYHTHSGLREAGASIWDAWLIVREFDPAAVAVNYDTAHATIEGGLGGWSHSLRVLGPHLGGVAVKDFAWEGNRVVWKPLGEGMVRLREIGGWLRRASFNGPVQLHVEYPLGGADTGKATLTIPRERVYAAIRADLDRLRTLWAA